VASCKSYDEFEILPNSIIYCDIPYFGTEKYAKQNFDYDKFYDWCEKQTVPVYISEYWMPEDRFECIAEKDVVRKLNGVSSKKCNEKLFIPKKKDTD
jgi:DNA adenine methylase